MRIERKISKKKCSKCGKVYKVSYGLLCFRCYSKKTSKLGDLARKEANNVWAQENPEKVKEYSKKYYQKNKEKIKEYYKTYQQINKEKIKEYYQRPEVKAKRKEYYQKKKMQEKERGAQ